MRFLAVFLLCAAGCSTFSATQRETFANSVSIVRAFAHDYAGTDCQGCGDCTAMAVLYPQAQAAVEALRDSEIDETRYRQYAATIESLAQTAAAVPCGCPADAAFCSASQQTLSLEVEKSREIVKGLESPGPVAAFFGGIVTGIQNGMGGLLDAIFSKPAPEPIPVPSPEPPTVPVVIPEEIR